MATKRVNLLPRDLRPSLELPHEMLSLGVGALFVVTVMVSASSSEVTIWNRQRRLASVQAENADLTAKVAAFNEKEQQLTQRQERLASFQKVVNRKTYWVEMFKELAAIMPEGVWLTKLNSAITDSGKNITLDGEAASQAKVAEFLKALEKSTYFNTIVINNSEKKDDYRPDLYTFEFSIPVAAAAPVLAAGAKGAKPGPKGRKS